MNPKLTSRILLVALASTANFLILCHAFATPRPHKDYVRKQWTVENGFAGGPVRALAQTPDGYLWIGSERGLMRFDGLEFRQIPSPEEFQNVPITGLVTDRAGKLWAFSWEAGLWQANGVGDELRSSHLARTAVQVTTIEKNKDGSMLLADGISGILRVRGESIERLEPPNVLPGSESVVAMAESGDGKIWLGTPAQGLFHFENGQAKAVDSGLPTRKINCLLPGGGNELLVGTDSGLFRGDGSHFTQVALPKEAKDAQVLTMLRDSQSNLWVGTSKGLIYLGSEGVWFSDENSFASGGVTALLEDREGNLWVGAASGLERLREKTFMTYATSQGLPRDIDGPVAVDGSGHTWVAPPDGGVAVISDGFVQRPSSPFLERNVIYSISSKDNELWMGTQQGGLAHVTYRKGVAATATYTRVDGLAENSIYSVYISHDGAIWAGSLTSGVSRLQNGKFVAYTNEDGLASNTVSAILETRDRKMLFATPRGLSQFADGSWKTYTTRDGLPSDSVNCLFEDNSGTLWLGTSSGIALLEHGRILTLPDLPSSVLRQVFGFAEDPQGRIWIETASQILRIRSERSSSGGVKSIDVREYGLADGLPSIEGVRRSSSVASGVGGQLWFSTRSGLIMVDSTHVPDDSAPALAHVDSISADNVPLPLIGSINVPPSRQRITFDYTGVSLTVPEKVRFRYFLQGFDRGWSKPVEAREAVYTNLGPGRYTFRLVASNSDGIWNGAETSINFRVEPAFWQAWWFYTLVTAILMLGLLFFYRLHMYQLTQQLNVRFLDRLAERNRIAQELHDTLLQSFQGLMLRFQDVSDMLPARPDEARQLLQGALDRADLALDESRDAIRGIRSTSSAVFNLAETMRALIDQTAEGMMLDDKEGVQSIVAVQGVPRELRIQVTDDICRIAQEALRNAKQHAESQQVKVEIIYSKDRLLLRVIDDGKGIDANVLEQGGRPGHWGLVGMRERAKRIGAKLSIFARPSGGTEVELTLPASLAYEFQHAGYRWRALLGHKPGNRQHD